MATSQQMAGCYAITNSLLSYSDFSRFKFTFKYITSHNYVIFLLRIEAIT